MDESVCPNPLQGGESAVEGADLPDDRSARQVMDRKQLCKELVHFGAPPISGAKQFDKQRRKSLGLEWNRSVLGKVSKRAGMPFLKVNGKSEINSCCSRVSLSTTKIEGERAGE
jgi:hypothetical protein